MEIATRHPERRPGAPGPFENGPLPLRQPAHHRSEEGEGGVSDRLGEHTRRVTHTDRSSPAPGDVDVVNPDRHLGHHLETRRGIEEDRIDPVGEHAEEPPDTGHGLEDPVPRHRLVTRPHLDIPHLMERGDQVLGERPGDEDLGHDRRA